MQNSNESEDLQKFKLEMKLSSRIRSRKFIFCSVVSIINTLLLVNGTLSEDVYQHIITITTLAYLTGNVAEFALTKRK